MNILAFDTSSEYAGIAISVSGAIIHTEVIKEKNSHAEALLPKIQEVLTLCKLKLEALDALVFCEGPGSYTGLRIGLSIAKGLCYAHNIPLVFVNRLSYMTASLKSEYENEDFIFVPVVDARRMEVYTAMYDKDMNALQPVSNLVITQKSVDDIYKYTNRNMLFFGSGIEKYKPFSKRHFVFHNDYINQPEQLITLGEKKIQAREYQDVNSSEPFYLKPFYTTAKLK